PLRLRLRGAGVPGAAGALRPLHGHHDDSIRGGHDPELPHRQRARLVRPLPRPDRPLAGERLLRLPGDAAVPAAAPRLLRGGPPRRLRPLAVPLARRPPPRPAGGGHRRPLRLPRQLELPPLAPDRYPEPPDAHRRTRPLRVPLRAAGAATAPD